MTLPRSLRPPVSPSLGDRRILFLMALAGIVAGYGGAVITNTLPYSRAGLDVTEGQMSLILAIARIVSLGAVVFSISGDRRGRRSPFLIAFAMLPLANIATAFAPNAAFFAAFQSVARFGLIAAGVLGLVLLAEELTPGVRGYGLGIQALATASGVGLSLILVPFASTGDNWRVVFALTGVGLLALPTLMRFLKESRAFDPQGMRISFGDAMGRGMGRVFWPLAAVSFFVHAFSAVTLDFALERL
ncbi:MAG: MFS transporter, partial [Acidimicrobiia bacterium]|nr:MFS transporter [Acidimicrobiia bacterium]